QPQDPVRRAVRRNYRHGAWVTEHLLRAGRGSCRQLPVRNRKGLQAVVRRRKIHGVIEVSRASVKGTDRARYGLDCLTVASSAEAAHSIPIEKIDAAFLAGADEQMRVSFAAGGVGKQDGATRAEIQISGFQAHLVERREVISKGEPSGGRELKKAVTEIGAPQMGVEWPVPGDYIDRA